MPDRLALSLWELGPKGDRFTHWTLEATAERLTTSLGKIGTRFISARRAVLLWVKSEFAWSIFKRIGIAIEIIHPTS